jgi:hypothetical protein
LHFIVAHDTSVLHRGQQYTRNYNDEVAEDEMGGACNTNVEKRNAYKLMVEKRKKKHVRMTRNVGGWITLR